MDFGSFKNKPSRESIINNYHTDKLYQHPAEKVKFYSMAIDQPADPLSDLYQASTRTQVQLTQNINNGEFEGLEIVKLVYGKETSRITLPKFTLDRICGFLTLVKDWGVDDHTHRRCIVVPEESLGDIGADARNGLLAVLSTHEGSSLIQTMLDSDDLTEGDMVNTGYRRRQ